MTNDRVISAALDTPWAIHPGKLREIEALLSDRAAGRRYTAEEIEAKIGGQRAAAIARRSGSVAVLPIHGTIAHRMGSLSETSGGISTERISGWLRAAVADESVKAIVLDIDSPGGTVSGVEELALEIHAAREAKPVVAVANAWAASAAYWLASQAEEVVVTPSGEVGSIGVYVAHIDKSRWAEREGLSVSLIHAGKYKVEGHPYGPLEDEARAEMQGKVDAYYRLFTGAVRRGRPQVSDDVMQGRMYVAQTAVSVGLADRVATLGETLRRYGGTPKRGGMRAERVAIERMRMELEE